MKSYFLRTVKLLAVAALLTGLGACASSAPTFGDQIIAKSQGTAEIGKQWNKANEMIADGNDLTAKGRKQVEDGQNNIAKGNDMVTRGAQMRADAETRFKSIPGNSLPASN